MCVYVCACVCVMYLLHCLCVLERSYVVLSSNCCIYMCLLSRGHVLRSGDCCAYVCLLQRGYVLRRVFDTHWLLHWPVLVSK